MNKIILLVGSLLMSCTLLKATPNMSIYEAINKAGYQRMLTQRVAKCYISITAGLDEDRHKTHLMGSAKAFENNLNELKVYAPNDKIRDQFRYVEILWRNYKFIYTNEFTTENATVVLQFNNKILKACHEAVQLLEEYALENKMYGDQEIQAGDQELAQIISLSGKQRMLTQRIALYAVAKTYGIGDSEENLQLYTEAISDFGTAYRKLMACSKNTVQIDEEYSAVSKQWGLLEADLGEVIVAPSLSIQVKEKLLNVLENADLVLFRFDEIVFLYERQKN
ncbi:MAG: type IV pili methyl-accepting chemotaxis transducer N-terminal domain-containing protein [Aureispira sp.]